MYWTYIHLMKAWLDGLSLLIKTHFFCDVGLLMGDHEELKSSAGM